MSVSPLLFSVLCSMTICSADFNVTLVSSPAPAVEGSNHSLRCQYNPPDTSTVRYLEVDWYKFKRSNTPVIFKAKKYNESGWADINKAQSGYKSQLNGSSISFPEFLFNHSIVFKRITGDDKGFYKCCVNFVGQKNARASNCSTRISVEVIGKYTYRVQICIELEQKYIYIYNIIQFICILESQDLCIYNIYLEIHIQNLVIDRDIYLGLYCICVRYLLTFQSCYCAGVRLFFPLLRLKNATAKSSNSIIFKFLVLVQ